jgi:hypothetical protein
VEKRRALRSDEADEASALAPAPGGPRWGRSSRRRLPVPGRGRRAVST